MSCLYHCIMGFLRDRMAHFQSKKIEFAFSVPTTWKDPAMIADIDRLIRGAGYGQQPNQKVVISLTEAEAAAVYASKQQMQKGDVFLVADAGGGTTDLNVLKVTSSARGRTELQPLHFNEGEAIGSTLIDHKAERMVLDRLKLIRADIQGGDLDSMARRMIQDRFMSYKCSFGSGVMNVPKLPLPIPDIALGQDFPHAGVENSNMVLKRFAHPAALPVTFADKVPVRICSTFSTSKFSGYASSSTSSFGYCRQLTLGKQWATWSYPEVWEARRTCRRRSGIDTNVVPDLVSSTLRT